MPRAIQATQTYPKATPVNPTNKAAFDVVVRTEGEPDVTLQVMAHDSSDAIDRVNGMPYGMLRELLELERVVSANLERVVHHG